MFHVKHVDITSNDSEAPGGIPPGAFTLDQTEPLLKEHTIPMGTLANVSDADFDTTISNSDVPVLVDFWAPWCQPCLKIAPVLEEIQGEMEGKLKIVKLDIDENMDTASKFEVMAIPTMILFKDGEVAHRLKGAKPKSALLDELRSAL